MNKKEIENAEVKEVEVNQSTEIVPFGSLGDCFKEIEKVINKPKKEIEKVQQSFDLSYDHIEEKLEQEKLEKDKQQKEIIKKNLENHRNKTKRKVKKVKPKKTEIIKDVREKIHKICGVKPRVLPNRTYSGPDVEYWLESTFILIFAHHISVGGIPKPFRLIFYKMCGDNEAYICSEYRNEKNERCVETFGLAKWDYTWINEKKCKALPKTKPVITEQFIYEHSDKGLIFKSHATPLIRLSPMNMAARFFCEKFVKHQLENEIVSKQIRKFKVWSFMKSNTARKIRKLVNSRQAEKFKKGLISVIEAKTKINKSLLDLNDIRDADLAFERFVLFKEHVSQTQPIAQQYLDDYDTALADYEIAKQLSN
jgi:hypothetical protein